jgi:ribosomal protein S18 acetylase RimI-like enzyme
VSVSPPPFRIEPLDKQDRAAFDSETAPLDHYLKTAASQDMRRGLAKCFLAIHIETSAVAGYYTLSASTVSIHDLPKGRNFGRYTSIPAVLLGRLAVDRRFQGKGLGRDLLIDAMSRTIRSDIASALFHIEAKNDQAAAFYRRHGFQAFPAAPHHFFMPIQDIRRMFSGGHLP